MERHTAAADAHPDKFAALRRRAETGVTISDIAELIKSRMRWSRWGRKTVTGLR